MSDFAQVTIHQSQFPHRIQAELLDSLHKRQLNHKFLYDSVKQTNKWLTLHQAHSPSRNDPQCAEIYAAAFSAVAKLVTSPQVHLLGLGCGGGQKDTQLLRLLRTNVPQLYYTPSDVSTPMVLTARQAALDVLAASNCRPLVCDLAVANDLASYFYQLPWSDVPRIITFFGMIPNFEPEQILPGLSSFLRPDDYLLFGANLAPGPDYLTGVQKILPQYDNAQTRDWLMSFLLGLGINESDGELRFEIVKGEQDLLKVVTYFDFKRACNLKLEGETISFSPGEQFRVFFSYRYTAPRIHSLLSRYGIQILEEWVTPSQEEAVFLGRLA